MERIYLDHAATTPMHPKVLQRMTSFQESYFGNPSSIHSFGRESRAFIDQARQYIAQSLGAKDREIVFTSGGTEADNLALFGVARAYQNKGRHIIISNQEHKAVLDPAKQLELEGFQITYLPVDSKGVISVKDLKNALRDETILVSIMYANNETGMIQPIDEIGYVLKDHQALFHTDAVQAYGQLNINVKEQGIDLLTASAHKMNGPKGIGFLYVNENIKLKPLQYGGEQERKRRAGTENIAGIIGFHEAAQITFKQRENLKQRNQRYKQLLLQTFIEKDVPFSINGDETKSLPSIVNVSFPGTNVEQLLTNFDIVGICASSGSACTAGSFESSHVLKAMYGTSDKRLRNSIRFSFGQGLTEELVKIAGERMSEIVKRLAK